MAMMNYDEHGKELNMSEAILHARKLRPLMPRPTTCSTLQPPHCCSIQNNSICAWNYHLTTSSVHHQSKREFNAEPLVSPRWNPTKEQIHALEEMYKRGLRTPTAEQIQQITQKLRQFGKIQGKNVFYWFQNHKARERQKWRRQLGFLPDKLRDIEALDKKKSELSKKDVEEEQKTKWAIHSNCRTKSEDFVWKHREVMAAESRTTSGWSQFEDRELQQTISKKKRAKKTTCHQVLSCHNQPHNNTTTTTLKACVVVNDDDDDIIMEMENENRKSQILQLFPIADNNEISSSSKEKENEVCKRNINTSLSPPMQFFEFLPLKT